MAGVVSAGSGHILGMNCRGHTFCSRLGNALQDRDVYAATRIFLRRVGMVWSIWYVLLPGLDVVGRQPRVLAAAGFPSWHWGGGATAIVTGHVYGAYGLETTLHPGPRFCGFCLSLGDPRPSVPLLPVAG